MGSRLVYLTTLATVVVIGAGCAGSETTAPVPPSPVTASQPDSTPPTETPPALLPDKERPAQAEASALPPTPAMDLPIFLQQILDAGWKLSGLVGLPPRERPAVETGKGELIYLGGALRLYQSGQDSLSALVVDHTQTAYQEFRTLTSGQNFVVAHRGKYTAVLRILPLDPTERAELAAREWTTAELAARFGDPTSRVHNHGIGTYDVTYVPQGLVFEEADRLELRKTSAEDVWKQAAEGLADWPDSVDQVLADGKPSPDGRFRAGSLNGGGYWSQWVVVRETGKSEAIYHADYFIQDFFWLDNHRLVYGEVQIGSEFEFHVIEVITERELEPMKVSDIVKEFGPADGNVIWYTGRDGARHDVNLSQVH